MYRGRCKYKSGKCMNERTTKENGQPHTLCEPHRIQHNKNQRKSDVKRRWLKRMERRMHREGGTAASSEDDDDDDEPDPPMKLEPQPNDATWEHVVATATDTKLEPMQWDDWSHEDIFILGEMVGLDKGTPRVSPPLEN
ncbi:unnamed protein product [Aphanomyces euteiches]|uniref:Uncharacterized protein n=1 Tax=Aphanomyces euteiches TaxID=100861 RepID=A0A6G0WSM6_9STRA|nr:hypothetical protein Ae201684_012136 [Aphanomyces euteiches]KAH9056002.1 hypothetical protein Ae201684P_021742 [Aphanomyces euteiches]KAH9108910.1 hypothetical protein AeMF1_015953 [Aphanomyces euteiches]KAH9134709.1 hypothetical protein AeRB84_019586 [Aphanomyces euteiches]KAH9161708.1 hypothetical protein LEN26_001317 [Aphanomyces euteiches]